MKKFLRRLFYYIADNNFVYLIAKRLTYDHDGENNCDINTNGELVVLKKYLKDCKVIFDVGANQGDWTELALSINPQLQIHLFEPSKFTFQILKDKLPNVKAVFNNIGLGDVEEEKEFYIQEDGSTVSSLFKRDFFESGKTEKVKIDTVDNYCQKLQLDNIDFLKIDVEGNEFNVLKGARKMLENGSIKFLQFEYGGTYIDADILLKDVFMYLDGLDYSVYKILHNRLKKIKKYEQALEDFQNANYLIINNKIDLKNL